MAVLFEKLNALVEEAKEFHNQLKAEFPQGEHQLITSGHTFTYRWEFSVRGKRAGCEASTNVAMLCAQRQSFDKFKRTTIDGFHKGKDDLEQGQ